jgi:hypothetical protein
MLQIYRSFLWERKIIQISWHSSTKKKKKWRRTKVHDETSHTKTRNYGSWDSTILIFIREIGRDKGDCVLQKKKKKN